MADLKFLHISDTHILRDYDTELDQWNVKYNPAEIFEEFLANYDFSRVDFVVNTGDLTNDGDREDFRYLKELMDKYIPEETPYYVVLGNHDDKNEFYQGFFGEDRDGLYLHQDTINGYRLVFMDSAQKGEHEGFIYQDQADWLFDILSEPAEKGTLLFHHHPLEVSWTDDVQKTTVIDGYLDKLQETDVIGIFTGHLHQNRHVNFGKIAQHTAGAFVFGMDRINDEVWIDNKLGYSEVAIKGTNIDVYSSIVSPKIELLKREY